MSSCQHRFHANNVQEVVKAPGEKRKFHLFSRPLAKRAHHLDRPFPRVVILDEQEYQRSLVEMISLGSCHLLFPGTPCASSKGKFTKYKIIPDIPCAMP